MNKKRDQLKKYYALLAIMLVLGSTAFSQDDTTWWHGKKRTIHYTPSGQDFVCVNGKFRFIRALYGTNTAFRVEAGDLPEFAMYMPGMGGNFKFGLISGSKSKWLNQANNIKAIYRPGAMLYEVQDSLLGNSVLYLTVLALADAEGMIIEAKCNGVVNGTKLCWVYGGASGKKFSRDGDLGADPESSFYLQLDYCKDNVFTIKDNCFALQYGTGKVLSETERYEIQQPNQPNSVKGEQQKAKQIFGVFATNAQLTIADATALQSPLLVQATSANKAPIVFGNINITSTKPYYFQLQNGTNNNTVDYSMLATIFNHAEQARKQLASTVMLHTPDVYLNTIGGALSVAADAIWETPSYMHGAIAWRMRLNAWRGPYVADPLGWHDRARLHFSSYAKSQVLSPLTGPVVADTALNLARQLEKLGTSMFSSGYISRNPGGDLRPHHYDMNLVFVDALLNHFNYTGDTNFVKQIWPLLVKHLDWEKRNFDADGDGLYDAYAAIWASDALQYSGGAVTHSSAYNYRANKTAAELALLIGKNATPYQAEADKIFTAINNTLWLKDKGCFAEYKDKMGLQLLHPSAALWTIYHSIDAALPTNFQAYQMLRYVDKQIPHIPVKALGLPGNFFVLSTTNWQPYDWSLNNVVLTENLHTALAYWQANRSEAAFKLWKSALVESMYLGTSPANFQQISFYDAARGELYRDFADVLGMAARSLTEGLFGILPNALHGKLVIKPGFPKNWNFATLNVPDINVSFKRNGNTDAYHIITNYTKNLQLQLQLNAYKQAIESITVNGKNVGYMVQQDAVESPVILINCGTSKAYNVEIIWKGQAIEKVVDEKVYANNDPFKFTAITAKVLAIKDPQQVLKKAIIVGNNVQAIISSQQGSKTVFVQLKQGNCIWWQPVCFTVKQVSTINPQLVVTGKFETIDLSNYFNDKVTSIFKNKYLSPRPATTTLQLPVQGIGNWCYPLTMAYINDSGLRKLAGANNQIKLPTGVPFATPHDSTNNNIIYTSQWDNYPKQVAIKLSGSASYMYLLMAGSTNPMQSRIANGLVVAKYKDGTADTLALINPQTWWPIEQDYLDDGYAFTVGATKPLRVHLKTALITNNFNHYTSIKGFSNRAIDGGAATVLEMPLQPTKMLENVELTTLCNDVVIGLMSVTLVRSF
ncbi:MAG: DUF4450 domain-containing protein [Flavobacterium sp.]|nr:DUF4450 domain-containing protein [Flavobacterium sp.]